MAIARAGLRVNAEIRSATVRVVNEEDVVVGVVGISEALAMAAEASLDLVEVSPNGEPPVCRIMDYGKWKYRRSKKTGKTKKAHVSTIKEVRLRPKTGLHDQQVELGRAREFIGKGDKVLFSMRFRGREMAHQDLGVAMLDRIKQELEDIAKVERDWSLDGRRLTMVLAPR